MRQVHTHTFRFNDHIPRRKKNSCSSFPRLSFPPSLPSPFILSTPLCTHARRQRNDDFHDQSALCVAALGCFDIVDLALLILTNDSQMQLHRVLCPCRKRPHKRALVSARLSTVRQRAAYLTHDARFLRRGHINHGNNFQPVSGIVQCNLTINPFTFVINYVVQR